MKKQYAAAIHTYFSDYVKWSLCVTVLFVATLVAIVAFKGVSKFFWVVPALFIVMYLSSIRHLILYSKARKDIKDNNIDRITIQTFTVELDKSFNFKNRGGVTIGKGKYRIIDENNNLYLISASNDNGLFMGFYPSPAFSLKMVVLKQSRLVLQMEMLENAKSIKESREQRHNIKHFKETFSHYF